MSFTALSVSTVFVSVFAFANALAAPIKTFELNCNVPKEKNKAELIVDDCIHRAQLTLGRVKMVQVSGKSQKTEMQEFQGETSEQELQKILKARIQGASFKGTKSPQTPVSSEYFALTLKGPALAQNSASTLPQSLSESSTRASEVKVPESVSKVATIDPVAIPSAPVSETKNAAPFVEANSAAKNYSMRVSLRAGIDREWNGNTWKERQIQAYGLDMAFIPKYSQLNLMRTEAGFVASSYNNQNVKTFSTVNGTLFVGVQSNANGGFVAGVRGLAGVLIKSEVAEFDGGGEVRMGGESEKIAAYASAGRTNHFTKIGVDLGFKF